MYDPEFQLHLRNSDCWYSVVLCWPVIEFKTYLFERDAKSNSLKDLFTELRFEISSFTWHCQEYDITKTSL